MTAAVTIVIMSAGGLATAGPLCGPHSPHSHLHFHWQLFSPHKKFNTPICEPCSAKEKCGIGKESSCFKSQLIVPPLLGGAQGVDPRALGASHLSIRLLGPWCRGHTTQKKSPIQPAQSFSPSKEIFVFHFMVGLSYYHENLITGEKMGGRREKGQNKLVGYFSSKSLSL